MKRTGVVRRASVGLIVLTLVMIVASTPIIATLSVGPRTDDDSSVTRIDESLLDVLNSDKEVDILLSYNHEISEYKAKAAIRMIDKTANIVESFTGLNMLRVKLVGQSISKLAELDFITNVWSNEPQEISTKTETLSPSVAAIEYQSAIDLIGGRGLWDQGYNGTGVVIAVLDTGVDSSHPDLDDFDDNSSTTDTKVTASASFSEGDSLPFDIIGHGTYAASIAAGTGNSSEGVYAGIAPGATILSAKVTLGGLFAMPSWIVSGIEWASSRGADIILLPFNTFGAPGDAVSVAVREASEKGIFVVAAAGDDGPDYLTIMSPGGSAAAFTVGAYDTENEEVPDFSGRGPSLDMLTKPDIVAPGVDIVGAKMGSGLSALGLGSFDLGDLGGLSGLFGGESDAEDLDDYYKVDDTTAASAAITAGAAAILMQAFDRATPIALGNVLRDTASSIGFGANDGGAGLLNLQAAFDYLSAKQDPIAPHNRTTGMSQLAFGLVTASGYDTSSIMLMSSYGTTIIALDTRPSQETSMHMLMGMFALRWSNRSPTNLMEFGVKSELHYTTLGSGDYGYTRMVGVLSYDDEIYVALLVESYNLTQYSVQPLSGFKITPYILNLGNAPIDNVSLFLSYSLDIFSDGEDDHGKYSLNTQEIFAYSQAESLDDFYFGLNSSIPFSAFEVGNSSEISSHISNDNLTGSTTFDGSVGLGMKWHFGELPVNKPANVSIAMGFGENRTILDASIAAQWELEPPSNIADSGDLIVIEADIPRVAEMGLEYETRSVVMNVGGNATQANAAFLIAKDEGDGLSIFSRVFTYDEIKPFHAEVMTTTWSPEKMGINTAAWIAAPDLALVMQLLTGTVDLLSLLNLLDNFLMRDLFVIEPISSTSVFPKQLPFAPFDIVFPADFGLYTFMLATTESLGNLTVQKHGNASDWGNATLPSAESVEGYYNFSLFLLAPPITMDGYHRCDYVIETEAGWTENITLERSLRYPRAMMLLDTSHGGGLSFMGGFGDIGGAGDLGGGMDFPLAQDTGGIDIGSGFDLGSLGDLGDLTGLLDAFRMTTFSGLSNLKKTMAASGLDLVETPGMDLNEDLLFQFSAVFSISPTEEFNSTEVDMLRDYTRNGGKLVILGDKDGTANLTGLNSLLSPFGYTMAGKHSHENTTDIITGTILGRNLDSIWLGEGTYILGNQSLSTALVNGNPVVLLDDSRPEMALFGSSKIFMNKNLMKCNNSILLSNLIEYLLRNTLTGVASLSEPTDRYEAGKSVYINLDLTDYYGNPVNDLFVAIAFELPNGTLAFFIAGFVEDGLYSSQFTPSYWRGAGTVNAIFIVMGGEDYANTYASASFILYEPSSTTTEQPPDRLLTMAQIAIIAAVGIFGGLTIALAYNRISKRRKMRIIEIEPEIIRQIDNMLNSLLAAFTQIEHLIQREDLDRVQKIESLRGLMQGLEEGRKLFKKVSDKVGGV